jgi:hypothetical protein
MSFYLVFEHSKSEKSVYMYKLADLEIYYKVLYLLKIPGEIV